MNCSTCNFPYPPCEIKDGICFECTHKAYVTLKTQLEAVTRERDNAREIGSRAIKDRHDLKLTIDGLYKQVGDLLALVKIETDRTETK